MSVPESNPASPASSPGRQQFNPRTLIPWAFLVVLGLAIGAPHGHWQTALLAIVSAAMTWGLIEEIAILSRLARSSGIPRDRRDELVPSIAWRCGAAVLLTLALVTLLLVHGEVIKLPERHDLLIIFENPFPDYVWQMYIIVVLFSTKSRWSPKQLAATGNRWSLTVAAWIVGAALAMIVLPQLALIHFLVHVATAGIHNAMPFQWQRPGVYPDHELEGFRLFWITVAVVASTIASCALLAWILGRRLKRATVAVLAGVIAGLLLSVAVAFDIWYYGWEFHRISPDLAGAVLVATWLDWLGAGILILLLVTAGAYRASLRAEITLEVPQAELQRWLRPRIHETPICLGFLLAWILWFGVDMGLTFCSSLRSLGFALSSVCLYMYFAICILGVQLCWARWHNRNKGPGIGLYVIEPARFLVAFLALLGLAAVGIPTMAAYCFNFWLGPWYTLRLP